MKTGDFVHQHGGPITAMIFRGTAEQAVMSYLKNHKILENNPELCRKVSIYYKGYMDGINQARKELVAQNESNRISSKMTESAIMKIQAEPVDSRF